MIAEALDVGNIDIDINDVRIVTRGALAAKAGSVVGLIGPNGCGKSSLLRTIYRALRPTTGHVRIGETDVWAASAREASLHSAVMLQDDSPEFEFSVREIVNLGRLPHQLPLRSSEPADDAAVLDAMERAGVTALADRLVSSLSGGERQRAYLARALAQHTPVIVLDEPTNHLDVRAQLELLTIVRESAATVVLAIHDLSMAAACCDELYLMSGGRLVAHGPTDSVLNPTLLERVYGVTVALGVNPLTGHRSVFFGVPIPRNPQEREHKHEETLPLPPGTRGGSRPRRMWSN
jgi:iron complex transport system ATP-binding protein